VSINIPVPRFLYDSALFPPGRPPLDFWACENDIAGAVDTTGWSATKWRDYRGTYSTTRVDGPVTYRYDWTLS
jgi:hypothetical protein